MLLPYPNPIEWSFLFSQALETEKRKLFNGRFYYLVRERAILIWIDTPHYQTEMLNQYDIFIGTWFRWWCMCNQSFSFFICWLGCIPISHCWFTSHIYPQIDQFRVQYDVFCQFSNGKVGRDLIMMRAWLQRRIRTMWDPPSASAWQASGGQVVQIVIQSWRGELRRKPISSVMLCSKRAIAFSDDETNTLDQKAQESRFPRSSLHTMVLMQQNLVALLASDTGLWKPACTFVFVPK